jgi:proliferating cell nuclear antigen
MLIKLDHPAILSKAIELISEIVTEVRLRVNDLGMSITAIDPANVALVGFGLPRNTFSQFETEEEVLGINLDNFKRILKRCSPNSSLILERKDNYLRIQIQDRIRRNFSLGLIEVEGEDIDFSSKVENMEFSSKVSINSTDLIASIEDCAVVADTCSFIIQEGGFKIEARGLDSAMSEFSGDEAEIQGENCKAKYSLEYLQKFIKGSRLCEKTVLEFANDHPLKMEIKTETMRLSFILAPRVETED